MKGLCVSSSLLGWSFRALLCLHERDNEVYGLSLSLSLTHTHTLSLIIVVTLLVLIVMIQSSITSTLPYYMV